MKYTYQVRMRVALWVMLGIACLASAPTVGAEPAWWTQQKRDCGLPANLAYNNWDGTCNSSPGGSTSAPIYNNGAAEAAAAERERKANEDRIERERLAEEKRKKEEAEFIRKRDATVLKGSVGTNTSQLKGLSGTDNYGLKGSETDAGAQLKRVDRHSREAQSQHNESDKDTARRGFDTPGKASGNLVYPDKKTRQAPPTALDKLIPPGRAKDDPQIKQMQAWYRSLDAQKTEKQQKIAEIKRQQRTSKDPVLDTKITTLANDVKRLNDDQAKAKETVKKRVLDMGISWNEKPATDNRAKK